MIYLSFAYTTPSHLWQGLEKFVRSLPLSAYPASVKYPSLDLKDMLGTLADLTVGGFWDGLEDVQGCKP